MPGNAFDRFVAEHRAIVWQARWVSEWVGPDLEAKHADDALRYHVSSQSQVRNMIVDLKDGLEYHYALEEGALRPLQPQTAETIGREHQSLLQLMDQVEDLLRSYSPGSAELGRAMMQVLQRIESQNAEEETVYRRFGEACADRSVSPLALSLSLPDF